MVRESNDSEHLINVAGLQFSLTILAMLVLLLFLRAGRSIGWPILVARFGAAVASPLVLRLDQRGTPTAIAVVIVVGIHAVLGLLIGLLLATSAA